jgi:hypothetical protein
LGEAEGLPPAVIVDSVLAWLHMILPKQAEACYAALKEKGYDDLSMVIEGDAEEVGVMIGAVQGIVGVKLPVVKKFKRELATLRGKGENFA